MSLSAVFWRTFGIWIHGPTSHVEFMEYGLGDRGKSDKGTLWNA